MSTHFDNLEKQARLLPLKEKAELARILIEELETSVDADVERLWIEEAQRRYDAYLRGKLASSDGEDVMNRARSRAVVSETEALTMRDSPKRNRFARECLKLDKVQEQKLADEGLASEASEWLEY